MSRLQSDRMDIHVRNAALLPCVVVVLREPAFDSVLAEAMPVMSRFARATPVVICRGDARCTATSQAVLVEPDGSISPLLVSGMTSRIFVQIAGAWWRRKLAAALVERSVAALCFRAVSAAFEADRVPTDCAELARRCGCTREHLTRRLGEEFGGTTFTPKHLIDLALVTELFVRLGMGESWYDVARELRVSVRTLRRALLRVQVAFGMEILDFRVLLFAVGNRLE